MRSNVNDEESASLLRQLRGAGLKLEGGRQLRVAGPKAALDENRAEIAANRYSLLDALQGEAEDEIANWPLDYRRWILWTVAYLLRCGHEREDAFWMAYWDVGAHLASYGPCIRPQEADPMFAAWLQITADGPQAIERTTADARRVSR